MRLRHRVWRHISDLLPAALPVVLIGIVGCSGFYTADPTATPGPVSTATPEGGAAEKVDVLAVVEEEARAAIGERLGEEVAAVLIDRITGRPFTNLQPGCMPRPAGYDGDYIIPGLVVSVFYEDVRYEYHTDENASVGGLCQSVAQLLPFTDLAELGAIKRPTAFLGGVVTARTRVEAQALMEDFQDAITLRLDDIDWAGEDLVGTTVTGTGCGFPARVNTVDWDIEGGVINVRIATVSEGDCEREHLVPVFILVENRPAGVPFTVIAGAISEIGAPIEPVAAESPDGQAGEQAPLLATATPNPIFEALDTAVAGGN